MKKLFLILPFMLCACVGSIKEMDVATESTSTAYLILDVEATFDGVKAKGESFSTSCFLQATNSVSVEKDKDISVVAKDTFQFRILKTPKPDIASFDSLQCLSYKVLWNKVRRKNIQPPLEVSLEPGTITYPGTIMVDWESEGFGGLDLINSGGGLLEDEGSMVLKRVDHSAAIKSKLQEQNPELLKKFKFVTTNFKDNEKLIQ